MKKVLLILVLLIPIVLKAQDSTSTVSNVEQFYNTPGYVIGHKLYDNPNCFISLMKYSDPISNDSIIGVMFYNTVITGFISNIKNHITFIDKEEVINIISWIDFAKKQIISDPSFEEISFVPHKGNILLSISKGSGNDFFVDIRYDKYDANSLKTLKMIRQRKTGYDFGELDEFSTAFKEMQKIIEGNKK